MLTEGFIVDEVAADDGSLPDRDYPSVELIEQARRIGIYDATRGVTVRARCHGLLLSFLFSMFLREAAPLAHPVLEAQRQEAYDWQRARMLEAASPFSQMFGGRRISR